MLTGINCVQFVVGAILVFCAFYSFIFLYRIFREVIGTERFDANLLSAFYFSFAYVMVSAIILPWREPAKVLRGYSSW